MHALLGLWTINTDKAGDFAYCTPSSFDEEIESMARLCERQRPISDGGSTTSDESFGFARGIGGRTESSLGALRSEAAILLGCGAADPEVSGQDTPIIDLEPASILKDVGGWISCAFLELSESDRSVQDQALSEGHVPQDCAGKTTKVGRTEGTRFESSLCAARDGQISEGSDCWVHVEEDDWNILQDTVRRLALLEAMGEITSDSPTAWYFSSWQQSQVMTDGV